MFCYQCEQTAHGTGCTVQGTCGKDPQTAALQDLLLHAVQGIAQYGHRLAGLGVRCPELDAFTLDALFATVTNVDFDPDRIAALVSQAVTLRTGARERYVAAAQGGGQTPAMPDGPALWQPAADRAGLVAQGEAVSIALRSARLGADIVGLQELLTYGIKGIAAYACHARTLGREDPAIIDFIYDSLTELAEAAPTTEALLDRVMRCGAVALTTLELLDAANTGAYGNPEPTPVRMGPIAGKAILVSGHDLKDLEILLTQTAGTGINVYTHGEMLPAHGYPALNKHPHLAGHFGGAWQRQRSEFAAFPGAILMTTNCIQAPQSAYRDRLFTSGLVGWPGIRHIADHDFTPVIEAARHAAGFTAADAAAPAAEHLVGFGHHAVLNVAGTVIDAVKSGAIRRFVLIGGCDGVEQGRSYYTDVAAQLPPDTMILTLGCGKFRVLGPDYGTVAGLPRLLDLGQCNDSYSAIKVAQALAEAFGVGINELPLSLLLSWYEQKAVTVLLALLHLGVRNIRLGPSLPAFVTPAVLKVLVDLFAISPIGTADGDIAAMGLAA
ncbi:MAG: hydroxylamine reductase [Azospirillaceae bacterium]|nr:hydroxylamine reductase [Azospirillaceae bacterium]